MNDPEKSTPNRHRCPLCQQPYIPNAAVRNFPPPEPAVAGDKEPQFRSFTFYGVCPNGHVVQETIEA